MTPAGIIGAAIIITVGVIVYKDKQKKQQLGAEKLQTGKRIEGGAHKKAKGASDGEKLPGYNFGDAYVPPEKRGSGVAAWLQATPTQPETGTSTVSFIFAGRKGSTKLAPR